MSTHDELDTLLPDLEGPVAPDPDFAAHLRRRFVTESGHRPTAPLRLIPVQTGTVGPTPIRASRRRWLDLAAVAILLLSMIGGIARVTNTGDISTPAIQAPQTEQPIMASGSAAMDGTVTGTAPQSGDYRLLWRGPMPGTGYIAPFRNTIYAVISRVGPTSSQGVVALNARTGAERWYQPASERFVPAVTSAGVVVGIPDSSSTGAGLWAFHVALLDLETGEPIWRSAETYQLPGGIRPSSAQIASGAVVFVDRQMTLAAIDLASGQERWRVESSEPPAPDCEGPNFQAPCSAAGPAILGDMVYFDNPVTGKIVAVSLRTGEQQWAVDDPFDRSETNLLYVDIVNLAAVDQGVVVSTGVSPNPEGWFGLLSATDGSTIWQWNSDKEVLGYVRAGDALIVLARDRGDSTWRLERVDLATGTVLLTSSELDLGDEFGFIRSLPDANLVILTSWTADSVGFNPESLTVTWTQPAIEGCKPFLPLLPDGNLACATKDGLAVYELVSELATPSASAGATIPAQIENGDFLITLTPGIITREEPAPDADIAAVYAEAGATLQYVGRSRIDSDGNLWYRVRNIETARVDWIPATDVVSDK